MLIDGRNLPAGSELGADLCIVGAGPAGITLACELLGQGCDIVLLESGGLEAEPQTQALSAGEIGGLGHVPLETARLRAFGGASGLWGGWCRPFDAIDFEERSWVPHSGWPIKLADLEPYYVQAQKLCELGPFDYDPAHWHLESVPPLPLPDPDIHTRLVQFSTPTRFGERYRAPIVSAGNVRLCIHSNMVQIEPSDNGQRIERLQVATLDNNRFTVKARRYVLAAGGIENARLLLASHQKLNTGIGNQHDLVGRYFIDHMQLDSAGVFPLRRDVPFDLYLGEDRQVMRQPRSAGPAVAVMGYFTLSAELQAAQRILNYSCKMPRTSLGDYYLHTQSQRISTAPLQQRLAERARTLAGSIPEAMSIASGRLLGREHRFYKLVTTQEQAPNPDSRVLLGQGKDRLGVPVARLHWAMNELDRRTAQLGIERLACAFEASGLAHIQIPVDLEAPCWPSNLGSSWHHCGMTRMHSDPKKGVVDAHCRVHGVENLYIAGSSVFTTNGHGNPTLTVIALTLRLADRLKQVLRQ